VLHQQLVLHRLLCYLMDLTIWQIVGIEKGKKGVTFQRIARLLTFQVSPVTYTLYQFLHPSIIVLIFLGWGAKQVNL
jgi:hypothetical protein